MIVSIEKRWKSDYTKELSGLGKGERGKSDYAEMLSSGHQNNEREDEK